MLVKPDGVKNNIFNELHNEFKLQNIEVLCTKKTQLTKEDIHLYFYHQFESFINYMCSSEVVAYFLKSKNLYIAEDIDIIKNKIRKNHNLSKKDLKNLIHGAQTGTEFFLQRELFFKEYATPLYTSGNDLFMKLEESDVSSLINRLIYLDRVSRLTKVIIDIPIYIYNELSNKLKRTVFSNLEVSCCFSLDSKVNNKLCGIVVFPHKEFILPKSFSVMSMLKSDTLRELRNLPCTIGVSDIEYNKQNILLDVDKIWTKDKFIDTVELNIRNEIEPIVDILIEKYGLECIMIDSPLFNLWEMEARAEIALDKDLMVFAGSIESKYNGLFGATYKHYRTFNGLI